MKRSQLRICATALVVLAAASCAKRDDSEDGLVVGKGVKAVVGTAKIGSQCDMGAVSPPVSVPLGLWECPGSFSSVTLAKELTPIYIQADCANGAISVRDFKGSRMSSDWYTMPDGSFSLTVDTPEPIVLATDHAGRTNCSLPTRIEAFGQLDCSKPSQPVITFGAEWMLGRPINPAASAGANQCALPSSGAGNGCYFYMETTIHQCT